MKQLSALHKVEIVIYNNKKGDYIICKFVIVTLLINLLDKKYKTLQTLEVIFNLHTAKFVISFIYRYCHWYYGSAIQSV